MRGPGQAVTTFGYDANGNTTSMVRSVSAWCPP